MTKEKTQLQKDEELINLCKDGQVNHIHPNLGYYVYARDLLAAQARVSEAKVRAELEEKIAKGRREGAVRVLETLRHIRDSLYGRDRGAPNLSYIVLKRVIEDLEDDLDTILKEESDE